MVEVVTNGQPDTAMMAFKDVISEKEIKAVVNFVIATFINGDKKNTVYHTVENGWPDHQQYKLAFPFVTGELPIDLEGETLTKKQQAGKQLFMSSCITCHEGYKSSEINFELIPQAVSYPRAGYQAGDEKRASDAVTSATPYAKHEIAPQLKNLTTAQIKGEQIFQQNCAFCHGADGTGKNWIGRFLERHPRDLTAKSFQEKMTPEHLKQVIREGLPGTTMSAWKQVLSDSEITALVAYLTRAFGQ